VCRRHTDGPRGLTRAPPTLLHVFPTFAVGGAQTRFAAVANHLGDAARHIVVALDGRTGAREKLDAGLEVRFAELPRRAGAREAFRILRQMRPDRLVTSNWGSMDWVAANALIGLPHLHTEDGFGPEEQDRQLPRRVWARRLLLRRSDVALPSHTLLHIARTAWRLPARRVHLVPNGIDTARFGGAAPMDAGLLAALGEGPVIGTIAALRPEKNIGRLIEAFALLRRTVPARLVIVGDGAERAALARQAAALQVSPHVLFAGHSTEAPRWMATFDVFALSSDTEQMPLSVLEAMAAGLPVVATDVGDVRRMVAAENRDLIVKRDAGSLAGALRQALASAAGAANRARARAEFDQAAMFRRYRSLLGIA
jgi:glycosyltransferase involved in cell wall biosynthesis